MKNFSSSKIAIIIRQISTILANVSDFPSRTRNSKDFSSIFRRNAFLLSKTLLLMEGIFVKLVEINWPFVKPTDWYHWEFHLFYFKQQQQQTTNNNNERPDQLVHV